jgi:nucleoid-associated protein YgaU
MPGNLLERLGGLFGRHASPTADEPPVSAPAEAPPVETPVEVVPPDVVNVEPAPEAISDVAVSSVETSPVVAEATVAADAAPSPVTDSSQSTEPAPAPEPVKSEEELLEERLWAETEQAWAQGDFETVTQRLDALKALEPEDAAAIDEKIAAAQYNSGAQVEGSGDLQRALFLYQEALRRNPNLGEAVFAIERVQAALAPTPPPAENAPEAPSEQTYTVQEGDSLWAIAEKIYGDGNSWTRIQEANSDQISDPDAIQPGQTLRIPS